VQTIAEESTAWANVSRPTSAGGLGFGFKWDMGWMHDTLKYMERDPVHRAHHHNEITFRALYTYTENYILPLSHDEVVHGKGSLLSKMPGDTWQKLANLRLLIGYMFAQPGKKMLFMGSELGSWREWNHDGPLEWNLTDVPEHAGIGRWVRDLNALYRREPALHEGDVEEGGFEWIDAGDQSQSVISLLRPSADRRRFVAIACNFTPVPRHDYRLGLPAGGTWVEALNSDADSYGGSGVGNLGRVEAKPIPSHNRPYSVELSLPPLACVFLCSKG